MSISGESAGRGSAILWRGGRCPCLDVALNWMIEISIIYTISGAITGTVAPHRHWKGDVTPERRGHRASRHAMISGGAC